MKRRIFCAVMTVVLVLTMLPVVVGAEGGPAITFDPVVAEDGKTVSVTVGIANNPGLVTATIPVKWDKDVLTLTDVEASTAVFATGFCGMTMEEYAANGTQGVYYLAWDNDTKEDGDFTGNGALAVMTFDVAEGKSGKTAVNSMSADIANLMDFDMNDHWGEVSYSAKEFELGTSGGEEEPDETTISIADVSVSTGNTVVLNINIENNKDLAGLTYKVNVPGQFDIKNVELGDAFAGMTLTPSNKESDGNYPNTLRLVCAANDPVTASGCIATLTIFVPENVEAGEYSITMAVESAYDSAYKPVVINTSAGTITVQDYVKGDVSGDGVTDVLDVVVLSRYLAEGYTLPATFNINACNISKDAGIDTEDYIDVLDVVILSRYLAGGYDISFD